MPGVERVTPDEALKDARALEALGIGGVILFGLPAEKDAVGTGGWVADGIVQETLRRFRDADLDLVLIADTVPVRVHRPRPLRPAPRRRQRRQRRHDRALRPRRRRARPRPAPTSSRPSAMMDGQVARDPRRARRGGPPGHGDHGLRGEDRLGVLRPVPRRRGLHAQLRRPARLPDGPGERPRVAARDAGRRRRGRGHAARQAGPAVSSTSSPRPAPGSTSRSAPTRSAASTPRSRPPRPTAGWTAAAPSPSPPPRSCAPAPGS